MAFSKFSFLPLVLATNNTKYEQEALHFAQVCQRGNLPTAQHMLYVWAHLADILLRISELFRRSHSSTFAALVLSFVSCARPFVHAYVRCIALFRFDVKGYICIFHTQSVNPQPMPYQACYIRTNSTSVRFHLIGCITCAWLPLTQFSCSAPCTNVKELYQYWYNYTLSYCVALCCTGKSGSACTKRPFVQCFDFLCTWMTPCICHWEL